MPVSNVSVFLYNQRSLAFSCIQNYTFLLILTSTLRAFHSVPGTMLIARRDFWMHAILWGVAI
jgi:hypothetical protein